MLVESDGCIVTLREEGEEESNRFSLEWVGVLPPSEFGDDMFKFAGVMETSCRWKEV